MQGLYSMGQNDIVVFCDQLGSSHTGARQEKPPQEEKVREDGKTGGKTCLAWDL